jgi:hypothetical protein
MLLVPCNNDQKENLHTQKFSQPMKMVAVRRKDTRWIVESSTAAFSPNESSEEDTTV